MQDGYPDLSYNPGSATLTIDYMSGEENYVPSWATQKSWLKSLLHGDYVTDRTTKKR